MKEAKFDIVFDSQQVFRTLLDSFAHPGKILKIPELEIMHPKYINYKAAVSILFTLLDHEVGFAVTTCDSNKELKKKLEEYLIINTGSKLKEFESADFILAVKELKEITKLKKGNLEYPDMGATVIYVIDEITNTSQGKEILNLALKGPGIDGKKETAFKGLKKTEVINIIEKNKEFPLGIDVIFTDNKGNICTLPRSVKIEILEDI